jgi:transcriptional regulator with XRE-family HTH domain
MQGSLPTRLRVLRAERGLTLREAAALTDVRPGTLSELERGVRHPHDVTLSRIAKGYGVPVEELLEEPALAGKAEAPEAGQARVAAKVPAPPSPEPPEAGAGEERSLRYLRAIASIGARLENRASGFLERAGDDPPWARFLSSTEHLAAIVDYVGLLADRGVLPAPADGPLPADEESVVSYILAISRRLHEVADRLSVFADQAELEVRRDNRDFWKEEEREAVRVRHQELVRASVAVWAKAHAG